METSDNLTLSLKARYPLIVLSTHEETRALDILKAYASTLVVWSATKGLVAVKKQSPRLSLPQNSTKPTEALAVLEKMDEEMVVVMCDAHPYLKDPVVVRAVRDCVQAFRAGGKTRSLGRLQDGRVPAGRAVFVGRVGPGELDARTEDYRGRDPAAVGIRFHCRHRGS